MALKALRRSPPKVSVAKVESVSCTQTKREESIFGVDLEKMNSLLPSTNKMRRIRRRTTEDNIGQQYLDHAYFKVRNHSNNNVNFNQYIVSTLDSREYNIYNNNNNNLLHENSSLLNDDESPTNDYLERRRRSNTLPGVIDLSSRPIPMDVAKTDLVATEKFKRLNFNNERKSKSLKKLRELVENVLRNNLEHCTYNAELSRKRCTHLSQILETTLKSSLNTVDNEYKVVAVVYIGEVRENGMKQSCQYNWNPDTDFFVMETYRREDMFATGIVFATYIDRNDVTNHNGVHSTNNSEQSSSEDNRERLSCI